MQALCASRSTAPKAICEVKNTTGADPERAGLRQHWSHIRCPRIPFRLFLGTWFPFTPCSCMRTDSLIQIKARTRCRICVTVVARRKPERWLAALQPGCNRLGLIDIKCMRGAAYSNSIAQPVLGGGGDTSKTSVRPTPALPRVPWVCAEEHATCSHAASRA